MWMSYVYFVIKGEFNSETITEKLGINPDFSWNIGDIRRDKQTKYDVSAWGIEYYAQEDTPLDGLCLNIVEKLKDKIDQLQSIKTQYDADFVLELVPYLSFDYEKSVPGITFCKEIIDFCSATETKIDIDIYFDIKRQGDGSIVL